MFIAHLVSRDGKEEEEAKVPDDQHDVPINEDKASSCGLPCSVCSASARHSNPKLCEDCQPWDDLTHLNFCMWPEYLDMRVNPFFYTNTVDLRNEFPTLRLVGKREPEYRDLKYFLERKDCMICSIVAESMLDYARRSNQTDIRFAIWRPFLFREAAAAYENRVWNRSGIKEALVETCLLPGSILASDGGDEDSSPVPLVLKFVLNYSLYGAKLQHVDRWKPGPIPLAQLKTWLDSCHETHGDECNALVAPMTAPRGFRVIDTTTNCIVERSGHLDYVALSYCWAAAAAPSQAEDIQLLRQNLQELSKPGGLQVEKLPLVIADSIQLCRDIGKQYLWVDRLCIVQDDPQSKHSQITAMDRIYHMANFSIVALTAQEGLPGVSGRPRDTRLATLDAAWDGMFDNSSGASMPNAEWAVLRSRWNTRGWTFQERKLSRRLVLIDERCAYFNCFQGSGWEGDMHSSNRRVPVEEGMHVPVNYSSYADFATAYSMRNLSFRSDILNAFTGVVNILAWQMETPLLFGLPERVFLQSLLWRSDDIPSRSDAALGIPSWSWASWDCTVEYVRRTAFGLPNVSTFECALHGYRPSSSATIGTLVKFFYSDPDRNAGVRPVVEEPAWFQTDFVDPSDFEEAARIILDPDRLDRSGLWQQCVHNPLDALPRRKIDGAARALAESIPGSLAFTSTCAFLRCREARNGAEKAALACLDILDEDGALVGQTMLMSRTHIGLMDSIGERHHVVVLGAGTAEFRREKSKWQDHAPGYPWGLYVMIAERRGGVLYRLAIGIVDVIAWTKVQPAWESVVVA